MILSTVTLLSKIKNDVAQSIVKINVGKLNWRFTNNEAVMADFIATNIEFINCIYLSNKNLSKAKILTIEDLDLVNRLENQFYQIFYYYIIMQRLIKNL